MKLTLDKKIARSRYVAVMIHSEGRLPAIWSLIQFGSLEPIIIYSLSEALQNNELQTVGSKEEEMQVKDVDEGWTLVTRQKKRKQNFVKKESRSYRKYKRKGKS